MKINFSDYIGVFVFLHRLLFYQLTAKNVVAGDCDRREIELSCTSACTLGKHKEVDIDGVVTEFARLKGRRPVGANRGRSLGVGGGKGVASPADILRGVSRVPSPCGENVRREG